MYNIQALEALRRLYFIVVELYFNNKYNSYFVIDVSYVSRGLLHNQYQKIIAWKQRNNSQRGLRIMILVLVIKQTKTIDPKNVNFVTLMVVNT